MDDGGAHGGRTEAEHRRTVRHDADEIAAWHHMLITSPQRTALDLARFLPPEHGAWAMLLVPFLLGANSHEGSTVVAGPNGMAQIAPDVSRAQLEALQSGHRCPLFVA